MGFFSKFKKKEGGDVKAAAPAPALASAQPAKQAAASPTLLTTNKPSGLYVLLHRALMQMEVAAEQAKQDMSAKHAAEDDR